ncbi:hypothetical protein AwDysgo_08070 [Bacteroidales bacterium]|nr:hypothetical protein AwDysgo_08070 [Bacteroidales bacterium]
MHQDLPTAAANTIASSPIIDSAMSLEQALDGSAAPESITSQLILLDVLYYSFDGLLHQGQLLINKQIKDDIIAVFDTIRQNKFPIARAIPIAHYQWNDNLSMAANNSSSFCYRTIEGTNRLSHHASGNAIDINPLLNPLVWKEPYQDRPNQPQGAIYDINIEGTLHAQHIVVRELQKRGFLWGRNFQRYYDNHHFQKNIPAISS